MLSDMVQLQSPTANTIYSKHYYYISNKPAWAIYPSSPPPAIATRILYADGADPYIQVPREDCAYGVDDQRVYYCAMALCAYDVSKREGSVECGLEEVGD